MSNTELQAELAKRGMLTADGSLRMPQSGPTPSQWQGAVPAMNGRRVPNLNQLAAAFDTNAGVKEMVRRQAGLSLASFQGQQTDEEMKANAGKMMKAIARLSEARRKQTYGFRGANEDLNAQPVQTLPVDTFLQNTFIENRVIQRAAADLPWLRFAVRRSAPAQKEIVWFKYNKRYENDDRLKASKEYNWGDEWPRTGVSDPVVRRASTSTWANGIEFTYEAMRYRNTAIDDVTRQTSDVGWSLNRDINELYLNALTNDLDPAQTGVPLDDQVILEAVDESWTSDERNPIEDLRDAVESMENETGKYFSPTVVFLHTKDHRRLMDYFTNVDHPYAKDPTSATSSLRTFDGMRIVKVTPNTGLPQGKAVLIDERADAPMTVYEDMDPRFTTTGLLHVRQYEHPETMNRVIMFHKTQVATLQESKAICLMSGM